MVEHPEPAVATAPRRLAGRYRLDRRLAVGGMAEVWVATDEVLERQVAVKMLRPELVGDAALAERFRREAVAAARLSHPAIVKVYDTVSDPGDEAVVMELVQGHTLRDELQDQGRLTVPDVVRIGLALADALEAAHEMGIVHRDVKPGNVLMAVDGRVLLTDFGIAKAIGATSDLTGDDRMMGTAKYLSPEQVKGLPLDGRSDLYGLGIVLYECLTGQVPFDGPHDSAVAMARLQRDPMPVRSLRPGVPRALDDLVGRLLARDPGDRPPDGAAVRDALQRLHGAEADDTRVVVLRDTTPVHGVAPTPVPEVRPLPRSLRNERRWLLPVVVIILIAVSVGVAGLVLGRTETGARLLRAARGQHDEPATASTSSPRSTLPALPTVIAVRELDPAPGDGREHPELLGNVNDGRADTAWTTENYKTRDMAGKAGVGLEVQLSAPPGAHRLTITSPTPGWTAQVFAADSPAATLSGWGKPLATVQARASSTDVDLTGARGPWVLVWFTELSDALPHYQVAVSEVAITR